MTSHTPQAQQLQKMLELLPVIHRIRDAEIAQTRELEQGPLEDLIAIIAEQFAIIEENIEQSYDDLFVETCANWLTPYIGDLIGYQSLYGNVPEVASPRAEVAHTIALRRRKGTVVVLEQLARDVTGWPATAVEYFQQLGCTQYSNHPRPQALYSPDFRHHEPLARIGTAFNRLQHTVDVRRVASNRGRFNIPNIGIYLWRLQSYEHSRVPALRLAERRYFISPLGNPLPLYSQPVKSPDGFIAELSAPINVPEPIGRRQLHDHLDQYYGHRASLAAPLDNTQPSIVLYIDDVEIPRDQIRASNLSDDGAGWAHTMDSGLYGIDPVLGRVALPADAADPANVSLSFSRGFSADMGGGEYQRQHRFHFDDSVDIARVPVRLPGDHPTIQQALDALGGAGVVEITDNSRYEEALTAVVAANSVIELRAAENCFPHIVLTAPFSISGAESSRFILNGLLISGDGLEVPASAGNQLSQLDISHCSLVPGLTLDADGNPVSATAASVRILQANVTLNIERSMSGPLRAVADGKIQLTDSILDATDEQLVALADPDGDSSGAAFSAAESTIIGKVHAREFGMVSNCILKARLAAGDGWSAAVWVERKQTGCVRFSFLPFDAIAPRRFRCQPNSAETALSLSPQFVSLRFATAAYGQLARKTADEIFRGADDQSEMGAFHHLYAPQRERNLQIRLREYLRVGLEAGLFYES
jgi:hypothetical protein